MADTLNGYCKPTTANDNIVAGDELTREGAQLVSEVEAFLADAALVSA